MNSPNRGKEIIRRKVSKLARSQIPEYNSQDEPASNT